MRGRHSSRLTQCYPCNLGHSKAGSGQCELCPENSFFFVSEETAEYFCAPCKKGYYSPKGSVGEQSCQRKRPCDEGDLHVAYKECKDGKRRVQYSWVDLNGDKEPDCDMHHPDAKVKQLPPNEDQECKQCDKGMSRDSHGNCNYCPIG